MVEGPAAGLEHIAVLESSGELAGYHLLHATRGELLARLERPTEASEAYRHALDLAPTEPERRFLTRRLAETHAMLARRPKTDR